MAIQETAYYEEADSTETMDLYELLLEEGVSIDFWFSKGTTTYFNGSICGL